MKKVEKDVVKTELEGELNWKEKIISKVFTKTVKKVYNAGVKRGFNWMNKYVHK